MTTTKTFTIGRAIAKTEKFALGTYYIKGDVVIYGNSMYLCTASTNGTQLPTDTDYFTVACKGIIAKGSYDSNLSYDINNLVIYNGSAYISVVNANSDLPTDNTKWMALPVFNLNAGFGVGGRYALVNPDNDLVSLWNLFDSGSITGNMTWYGGLTALTQTYRPIIAFQTACPYIDCTAAYSQYHGVDSTVKNYQTGVDCNWSDIALSDGDSITMSFLVFLNATQKSPYITLYSSSWEASDYATANDRGLTVRMTNNTLFIQHQRVSNGSVTSDVTLASVSISSYLVAGAMNDITVVLTRTSTGYTIKSFVNGNLISTTSPSQNYDITVTKGYLGYAYNSYMESYPRGLAQVAVYSGEKYSATYTPQYVLLNKPGV